MARELVRFTRQDSMTDEAFATFLNIPLELVSKFKPEVRARYEALAIKSFEVELYDAGIGPKPVGVIVDYDRRMTKP